MPKMVIDNTDDDESKKGEVEVGSSTTTSEQSNSTSDLDIKLTDLFIQALWGDSSHDFSTGGGIIGDGADDREASIQEMGSILSNTTSSEKTQDAIVKFIKNAYKNARAGDDEDGEEEEEEEVTDHDMLPQVGAHAFEEMGHEYLYKQLLLNGKFFFANPSDSVFGEDLTPSVNIQPQLSSKIFAKKSERQNFPTAMQYNKSWSALRNLYHPYDGSNIYGEIVNTLFLDIQSTDKKQMIKDMILKNLENPTEKTNIIYVDALGKAVESLIGAWSQIILHYKRNQMQSGMLQGANISTIFDEASQIVTKFSKTIKELHTDFQIVDCDDTTFFQPFTVDLVDSDTKPILRVKQEPILIENIEIDKMNASIMENLKNFYKYFLEEFKEPDTFKATDNPKLFPIVTRRYTRFKENLIQYWQYFASETTKLEWLGDNNNAMKQEARRWTGLYYHEGKTPSYNTLEYWKYYGYIDKSKLIKIDDTEFFFITHDNGTTSEHFYSEESRKKLIDSQLSIFKGNDTRKTAIKIALKGAIDNDDDATLKQMLHPEGYVSERDLKEAKKIINGIYESSSSDESETDASSSDSSEEDANKEGPPKQDSSSEDGELSEDEDDESDWNRLVYFILCNYFKDPIDYRNISKIHFNSAFERAMKRKTFRILPAKVDRFKKNLFNENKDSDGKTPPYQQLTETFTKLNDKINKYKTMSDAHRFDRCIGKEMKYFCDLIKETENDKEFQYYDNERLKKLAKTNKAEAKKTINMQKYEPLRCLHPFLFSPKDENILSCRKYNTEQFLEGTFSIKQQGSNYYKNSTRWNNKSGNDFLTKYSSYDVAMNGNDQEEEQDKEKQFLKEMVKELFMYDFNYNYEDSNEFEDISKYEALTYTKKYNRYVIPIANQSNSLRILEEVSTQFDKKLELNPEKLKAKETVTYLPNNTEKISFENDYPSVTNCVYMWRKMLMMFTIMFDIGEDDTYSKEDISEYLNLVPVPKKKSTDSDEKAERGAKVPEKLKKFQTELVSFMFSENTDTTIQSDFYKWVRKDKNTTPNDTKENKKPAIQKEEKNKKMPTCDINDIIVYTIGKKSFAIGEIATIEINEKDGTLKRYICNEKEDLGQMKVNERIQRKPLKNDVKVKEAQIIFIKVNDGFIDFNEYEEDNVDEKNTQIDANEINNFKTNIYEKIKSLVGAKKTPPSEDLLQMMYSNLSKEERNLLHDIVSQASSLENLKERCKIGLGLIKFTKTTADFMQFAIVKYFNEKYGKNNLGLYVNHIAATFDKQAAIIAAIIDASLLFEKKGDEGGARGTYVYIAADKNISSLTEEEVDGIIKDRFNLKDPIIRMIVYKCLNYDPTVQEGEYYWGKKFTEVEIKNMKAAYKKMGEKDEVDFSIGKLTEIKKDLMKYYLKKGVEISCKDQLKTHLQNIYGKELNITREDAFYEKTATKYLSDPFKLFEKIQTKYTLGPQGSPKKGFITQDEWKKLYEKEKTLERIEKYEDLETDVNIAKAKLLIDKWEAEKEERKELDSNIIKEIEQLNQILNEILTKVDEIKGKEEYDGKKRDLNFLNKYIQSLLTHINELKHNSVKEAQFEAIHSVQNAMKKISIKQHSIETINNRSGILPSSHDKIEKQNDYYVRFEYNGATGMKKNIPLSNLSQYTLFKRGHEDCVTSILELRRKGNNTITNETFKSFYNKSMEELDKHYINPFLPILKEIKDLLIDENWKKFMVNMRNNTVKKMGAAQKNNIEECLKQIKAKLIDDIRELQEQVRPSSYSVAEYVEYLNKNNDANIVYIDELNKAEVSNSAENIMNNFLFDIEGNLNINNFAKSPLRSTTKKKELNNVRDRSQSKGKRNMMEVREDYRNNNEIKRMSSSDDEMDVEGDELEKDVAILISKNESADESTEQEIIKELGERLITAEKEIVRLKLKYEEQENGEKKQKINKRLKRMRDIKGKFETYVLGKRKRGGKIKLRLRKSLKQKRKHFPTRSKRIKNRKSTKKHIRIKHNTKKRTK
jgi:hypothetical protein